MDGIDAALVRIDPTQPHALPTMGAAKTFPFTAELTDALISAKRAVEDNPSQWIGTASCQALDQALANAFAEAVAALLAHAQMTPDQITAIGSHGQTLSHRPDDDPPISLQLGDPRLIAERTGLTVVGRFRQADLDAGGQGAPLAPLLHQHLFFSDQASCAVLNLGGIANLTWLKAKDPLLGFDTGPANALMDAWYQRHHTTPKAPRFDRDGQWAASGTVNGSLLTAWLADPFFQRPPPKSTSIEVFGEAFLDQHATAMAQCRPQDVQATLVQLTAITITQAIQRLGGVERVIVCGGGAHNQTLMHCLEKALPQTRWVTAHTMGHSTDHLEAMLFAWLAQQRLAEVAQPTPSITGARHAVLLGDVFTPSQG